MPRAGNNHRHSCSTPQHQRSIITQLSSVPGASTIATTFIKVLRKHWPALLVLGLGLGRNLRNPDPSWIEVVLICVAGAGVLMNSLVIVLNGAMPVATSADQITEEERDWYHPIDEQTRLPWLADWVDVGWAWYSPGDFLIEAAALGLIVRMLCLVFV